MTRNASFYARFRARVAMAALLAAASCAAQAQIIQGLQPRNVLGAYATLPTDVTPNFSYYGPVVFGYSIGGYLQTPYFIGAELRGTIQRRLNAEHEAAALIGPRVAVRVGHWAPYATFLIGEGNGWRWKNPPVNGQKRVLPVEGMGTQWTIAGGVDYKLSHRFSARVGDISYSKLYLKNWTLTPLNVTAGVVYRLR